MANGRASRLADRSLLALCLGVVVVRSRLVGLVVADDAASGRAQLAMTGHVASDTADNSALDAALGIGAGHAAQRESHCESRCDHQSHSASSDDRVRRTNADTRSLFPAPRAFARRNYLRPSRIM